MLLNRRNRLVEQQLRARAGRDLGIRQRQPKRIDRRLAGDAQPAAHRRIDIRPARAHRRRRKALDRDAICGRLARICIEPRQIILIERQHQRAAGPQIDPQLVAQRREYRMRLRDQPRLQRAGRRIEAGMSDRGVGAADALADIVLGLAQRQPQIVARQRPQHRAAHHAAADHQHIADFKLRIENRN